MPPATGFLVGVHVGAGASLSQSGVPDDAPVAGLKPLSLPLNEPAVVAKWSMKPSPAGLSGVSSFAAREALGGGGLTGAAGGVLGGGGLAGAVVAKWSMKPSPAGLSGVSSLAAGEALGGGGLTRAAGEALGGGGLTGAAVAANDACGACE